MSETSGEKLQCGRSVTYQTGNRPLQMPLFAAAHTQSPNKLTAEKNEVTKIDDRYKQILVFKNLTSIYSQVLLYVASVLRFPAK